MEAAQRVGADRIQVRLGGTGTPDFERYLKTRYAPPLATFLGRVTPSEFFAEIDILVAPSLVEEASGRVVHEAFGFGIPAVGVSAGGMAELIREGATGFIVPAGDVAALEGLLRRLLADPPDWTALSAACLREAERFGFDNVFREYSAAWNDVLSISRSADRPSARPRTAEPRSALVHELPRCD